VTPDRISVTIPSYAFPHSVVDATSKASIGQHMELTGQVTRIDGDKVTISLRPLVTVDIEHVRLVESYVAPKRTNIAGRQPWPKMTKLSDLGLPILGKRHGPESADKREHFYNCPNCGQLVD